MSELLPQIEIQTIASNAGLEYGIEDFVVHDSRINCSEFVKDKVYRARHFSITTVISGELCVRVNLSEYCLKEGDLLIIPPSVIRQLTWEDKNTHFFGLLFTQDFLTKTGILDKYLSVAQFFKSSTQLYCNIEKNDYLLLEKITGCLYELLHRNNPGSSDTAVMHSLFKAFLLKVKQYFDNPQQGTSIANTIIYRFLQLLSENYLKHRDVYFYAQNLNISEKYLTQLLKKKTGKTARNFITEMVVLEAKVLLNNESLSIKQIANRLNFENQFHFSRFFKQYAGIAPTEHRK
ncbi:hypothetical protein A9P82_04905 [Arachidicoccus ginsenosidimutans]|uniref:helix-turn-helix domain-containing protein n=1 Tax=Arachidicoccus sp. BS20 TaxID=1850526 RepID=UPI0007F0DF83|nr:helix-turn-helix domain-containing protein [Arachidicoccus sp. BS20]ANI88681.1 hypothetical protein A9P82_04905 [Arachidicoccus sp. BS20]